MNNNVLIIYFILANSKISLIIRVFMETKKRYLYIVGFLLKLGILKYVSKNEFLKLLDFYVKKLI